MQSTPLSLREPTVHQFVYLLRQASSDTRQDQLKRRQSFSNQVRKAVTHLHTLLGEEIPEIDLCEPEQVGRHEQIQVYPKPGHSSPFPLSDDTRYVWLWAFAVHDSYMIRIVYAAKGTYPVHTLVRMATEWLWQPSCRSDTWGQAVYHTAIVPANQAAQLAQAVLTAREGERATGGPSEFEYTAIDTKAGPLFASSGIQDVGVLAYPDEDAESRANYLFDVVIPELEWYEYRVRMQSTVYNTQLYPALDRAEKAINGATDRVLHQESKRGSTQCRLDRLQAELNALSGAYLDLSHLVGGAKMMAQTIAINLNNYSRTLPHLLSDEQEAETIAGTWLRAGFRDQAQIEADVTYQVVILNRAETALHAIQSHVDIVRAEIDHNTNLTLGVMGAVIALVVGIVSLNDVSRRLYLTIGAAVLGTLWLAVRWLRQRWRERNTP